MTGLYGWGSAQRAMSEEARAIMSSPENNVTERDEMPVIECCALCDGTGEVYESCDCYECEYDVKHARYLPCPDCHPEADDAR